MELTFSNRWKQVVCNATEFKETFRFPNGTDVHSIQTDLCADAMKQDSAIQDLLRRLNMTDVFNAVSYFI